MNEVDIARVRFVQQDAIPKENSVQLTEVSPGCVHVHLGFLQFHHSYSIALDVPKAYFPGRCLNSLMEAAENGDPCLNCRLISLEDDCDRFRMTVEFHARKEKLLKEEMFFKFDDGIVKFVFIAKVLGQGKGTPLLKNEIKCIGAEDDETSEASDWPGF